MFTHTANNWIFPTDVIYCLWWFFFFLFSLTHLNASQYNQREIFVWNFSGQLEYFATHQHLLSIEVIHMHHITSHRIHSNLIRNRGSTFSSPPSHHPLRTSLSGDCLWLERRVKWSLMHIAAQILRHHCNRSGGPTSRSKISTSWCQHS